MIQFLATVLAALACAATAIVVPAVYLQGLDTITIGTVIIDFVRWAPIAFMAYVGLNILSAFLGQRHPVLYWLDYLASWAAAVSITFTAVWVGIGVVENYESVEQVMSLLYLKWVLVGLMLFSWVDVAFLQGEKHNIALRNAAALRAMAPPPPAQAAAPVAAAPIPVPVVRHVHPGMVVLTIIAILLVGGILAALLGYTDKVQFTGGDCVDGRRFVEQGTSADGNVIYKLIPCDN